MRVFSFSSSSADKFAEHLFDLYGTSTAWEASARLPHFRAEFKACQLGRVSLARCDVAGYSVSRALKDAIQISIQLRGQLKVTRGNSTEYFQRSNQNAVVSALGDRVTYSVGAGSGMIAILSLKDLIETAERLNRNVGRSFWEQVQPSLDLKGKEAAALGRNLIASHSELLALHEAGFDQYASKGFEDIILSLAVAALIPGKNGSARFTPSQAHKIRDYIAEHCTDPMSISVVAERFGMSVRSLQQQFQRHFNCSPKEFLTRCRIERARAMLATAHPADSAAEIAWRSGFTDYSVFSAKYLQFIGELPSETLRRAKNG